MKRFLQNVNIRKGGRRLLALCLSLVLSISLLPVTARAFQTYTTDQWKWSINSHMSWWNGLSKADKEYYINYVVWSWNKPALPIAVSEALQQYKKCAAANPNFDGSGVILSYGGGVLMPLEGEWREYYHKQLGERYVSSLSEEKREEVFEKWTSSGAPLADEKIGGSLTVKITSAEIKAADLWNYSGDSYGYHDENFEIHYPLPYSLELRYIANVNPSGAKDIIERDSFRKITPNLMKNLLINAEGKSIQPKNTYVFSVTNGSQATDQIDFFAIRYKDTNGIQRAEYVFPTSESLRDSYTAASGGLDYRIRTQMFADYTDNKLLGISDVKALQPMATDQYLVQTLYEVASVNSIDVFMHYSPNKSNSWTCQDIRLYKVDDLYGLGMYGYASDDYYIDFTGSLIAQLTGDNVFNLGMVDKLFHIVGGDYTAQYRLDQTVEPYSAHMDATAVLRMDIADNSGAEVSDLAVPYKGKNTLSTMKPEEKVFLQINYVDIYDVIRTVTIPFATAALCWALDEGYAPAAAKTAGLAQMGDTLMLPVRLPDFKAFSNVGGYPGISVDYRGEGTMSIAGFSVYDLSKTSGITLSVKMNGQSNETAALTIDTLRSQREQNKIRSVYIEGEIEDNDEEQKPPYINGTDDDGGYVQAPMEMAPMPELAPDDEPSEDVPGLIIDYGSPRGGIRGLFGNATAAVGLAASGGSLMDSLISMVGKSVAIVGGSTGGDFYGTHDPIEKIPGQNTDIGSMLLGNSGSGSSSGGSSNDGVASGTVSGGEKLFVVKTSDTVRGDGYLSTSLEYEIYGNPTSYYVASSTSGLEIKARNKTQIGLSAYDASRKPRMLPTSSTETYLVVVQTDDVDAAASSEEVNIKLQYHTTDDKDVSSTIDVREAMESYYGYWPGIVGSTDKNVAYEMTANQGQDLKFIFSANDIAYFSGVSFSMSKTARDDWQIKKVSVYRITDMSRRLVKWSEISVGNARSDRRFDRDCTLDNDAKPVASVSAVVLIQPGNDRTISFTDTVNQVKDNDVDWSGMRYYMTYADATQDLGFMKARRTYTVNVKVGGQVVTSIEDGDCGSKNPFYFQLIFEDGTSGYVMANQQLSADGFRTGQKESFVIETNYDYGDLKAIRVIPDDLTTTSDVFDKLNIEYIEVVSNSDSSTEMVWRSNVNDWIGVDYRDQGAKDSMRGMAGRSEAEIAHTYAVDSKGYNLKFVVAMETLGYVGGTYGDKEFPAVPYEGTLYAKVQYFDSRGQRQNASFDLAALMATYANKSANVSTKSRYNDNGDLETMRIVDNSYMMREGHTDRFIISLNDVSQILSMTLQLHSDVVTTWRLGEVDIYQITSPSTGLTYNASGEYYQHHEVNFVCRNNNGTSYEKFLPIDSEQELTITFEEHTIEGGTETNGWNSVVTREPDTHDDVLNLFVYMQPGSTPVKDYNRMDASLDYRISYAERTDSKGGLTTYKDQDVRTNLKNMDYDSEHDMFYAYGLGVSGFSKLSSVTMRADSNRTVHANVDYGIVQHVRDGVILNTYFLDFGGRNADTTSCYALPLPLSSLQPEQQVVNVAFKTRDGALALNENTDVMVALMYTMPDGANQTPYRSRYISLTDQEITRLASGNTVQLTFNESNVGNVTGVTVMAVGNAVDNVTVEAASVNTFYQQTSASGNHWVSKGFYSFADGEHLQNGPVTLECTHDGNTTKRKNSVTPITFTITTTEGALTSNSRATGPVRMQIAYVDNNKNRAWHEIDDLQQVLLSGSLEAGDTAVARVLIKDLRALSYVTFEPYDDSDASFATWMVGNVEADINLNGTVTAQKRTVNEMIMEGQPYNVNLSETTIMVRAYTMDSVTHSPTERTAVSGSMDGFYIRNGQTIDITAAVSGTLSGMVYKAERVSSDGFAKSDADQCLRVVSNGEDGSVKLTFTPYDNTSGSDEGYQITVMSQEVNAVCVVIPVRVKSGEETGTVPTSSQPTQTQPAETPTQPAETPTEPEETPDGTSH